MPLHLAAGLARAGRRVLLIDLHSSVKAPRYHRQIRQKNLYHAVVDGIPLSSCVTSIGTNLDVIGSQGLHPAELVVPDEVWKHTLFRKLFQCSSEFLSRYDYVLFDAGSDAGSPLGMLTQDALCVSSEAILGIPTTVHGFDDGLKIVRMISTCSRLSDNKVRISRILPLDYRPKTAEARSVLALLYSEFTGRLVGQPLEASTALDNAARRGCSVYITPSKTARQFHNVGEMIVHDEQLYGGIRQEEVWKQASLHHWNGVNDARVEVSFHAEKINSETTEEEPPDYEVMAYAT